METPPPLSEPPIQAPQPITTSLPARLTNVFAEPGEVFEEIKAAPPATGNWLVPVFLWVLVGIVASVILLSQPAIQHQIREQQAKAMDKMVQQGKMTREQADQATAMAEKFTGPTMLMIFGSVGALVAGFAHVFWWALVLWLLGRWFLKSYFPYVKALEVSGLSMMIWVLSGILGVLLGIILGRMYATPSAALFINEFDPTSKGQLLLATLNPFHFWLVLVMAIGLAKIANAPFSRAAILLLGFWILQEALFIAIPGMGQMAL
jgi:hypothetical protein